MELKGTIMEKMGIGARMCFNQETYEQAIESLKALNDPKEINQEITYDSENYCIDGLAQILGLSEEEVNQMKSEIYTKSEFSPELADKIRNGMEGVGLEKGIVDILSVVHDGWVSRNGNNFEGRPKNFQFVDFRLLTYSEARKDLYFVKPILEACGIEVDEEKVKGEFMDGQKQYIAEKGIDSHDALVRLLQKGADLYPVLEGISTNKKNEEGPSYLITDLLADPEVAERTASQIEAEFKRELDKENEHTKGEAKAFANEPPLEYVLVRAMKDRNNTTDKDVSDEE